MNEICPVSKYKIRTSNDWVFTSEDGKYRMEVSIIGHNIIHLTNYGYTSLKIVQEFQPKIEAVIGQEFQKRAYFLVWNIQNFKGISIKARNNYIKWVMENTPQIMGVFLYNMNSFTRILVKTSGLILKKNFFGLNNYNETILKIIDINKRLSIEDKPITPESQDNYCPISGYEVKAPKSWVFSADNGKYRIEVSIIGGNILHVKNKGYATIQITNTVWPLMFNIFDSELKGKKFFLMHDYSDYKGATSEVRNNYIAWIKENSDDIQGIYFYNSSPLTKILINSGRLFFKEFKKLYVFNSYTEAILSIKKQKDEQNPVSVENQFVKEWENGCVLSTINNKIFSVTKSWHYTYKDANISTYLINENIFIRKYKGILKEEISDKTAQDFVKILKECNITSYHFYTQFNEDAKFTLKFRKYGVKWFNENRGDILTSGFFNLSFINRVAVNVGKTFMYHKDFKERLFMLDKVEDIFNTIEEYNLPPKESQEVKYRKKSKDELVKLLLQAKKEKEEILDSQNDEIVKLYNKLGRLSWDEDYNFDENNIDSRDHPFSDLNNAIFLVQEDVKELLSRRDEVAKKAQESDRLKSAFLANMSHEIRTPLNSILGFSDLLKEASQDEETTKKYASIIVDNGNTLFNLINDIVDVSKIEAGQMQIVSEAFFVSKMLSKTFEIFENSKELKDKNVSFLFDNRINNGLQIVSDKLRIQQIINNLINNAFKFTESGYVKLISKYEDHFLSILIEDSGIGIDEEKQSIIFDRFRQENVDTTHSYGGSGLGLSISRSLAQMLGGDIFLTSEKGKGSVFELKLPVELVD